MDGPSSAGRCLLPTPLQLEIITASTAATRRAKPNGWQNAYRVGWDASLGFQVIATAEPAEITSGNNAYRIGRQRQLDHVSYNTRPSIVTGNRNSETPTAEGNKNRNNGGLDLAGVLDQHGACLRQEARGY